MANGLGKGSSVPAKIMAGLTVSVLLGLGLCGFGSATSSHLEKLAAVLIVTGAFFFWGGLILLILFGVGWLVVAIGKSLFEKKD